MQLFLHAQSTHTLDVTGKEAVGEFKAHVESLERVSAVDPVILLTGTLLDDDAIIGQCGISEHCTLEVAARLLGGNSHGSLAGAGKVKGQTPKVAKQKRKKTDRAKRHMQYNCCFVNVVPHFGKRKGPNSNP
ncbi:ubiquitin-like protein FUBI [Carcharodon carcharias]|uniref:ubiquitin-like protein FUBI n=1 Tax=Carcharodon carcharias TaxID=13397 RepID=UPI001B7F1B1C|nr:ubiquitin-like protein FUBI [Carcharodon carcharias]